MKNRLLALFIFLFAGIATHAQQTEIHGSVVSSDKKALRGASVQIKGSANLVQTDSAGKFRIKVSDKSAVLVFSFIGMENKEYAAAALPHPVVLGDMSNALSDVVVVGYGTVKRKDLTGSVAQAPIKDMVNAPVVSFEQSLAGRIAGVQVNASDGQPGSSMNIVIRGANSVTQGNSPLYVIDGFPIENPDNSTINPDDIESMDVLKDASATAIYGARGANGVIIITTKRGKMGDPVVSYNGYYGVQNNLKTMKLMDPYNFVKYQVELNPNTGTTTSGAPSTLTPTQLYLSGGTTLDYYKDTAKFIDYQNMIYRSAPIFDNTLSLTGGNDKTRYAVSGNLFNQQGIIINSGYKRYQGRMSLDQTLSKKFKVGINANYSYLYQNGAIVSTPSSSSTSSAMYSVWGFRPVNPSPASLNALGISLSAFTDPSLTDPSVSSTNDYRANPVMNLSNVVNNNITRDIIANGYLEYTISPGLVFKSTFGLDSRRLTAQRFYNSKTSAGSSISNTQGVNGSVTNTDYNSWLNENYLTYSKTFNKVHAFTAMIDMSEQQVSTSSYGMAAINVPNESLGINALSQGTPQPVTSTASTNTSASFLGRVNYSYKSKYLFTVSYRADGSSKFATQNKWGYFPSGAFAWRFSDEKFMSGLKNIVSDGKLRITYGQTGNNRVSDFAYLPVYTQTPGNGIGFSQSTYTFYNNYSFNNNPIAGAVPTTIGNSNLKWETTSQYDLGLDLQLFKKFMNLTIDVYRKKTYNLLLNAAVPTSSGYASVYENIGNVQNQGLEIGVSTNNIQTKNFRWTSSFNISFNQNKVLALSGGQESLISNIAWDNGWASTPAYIAKVGQPLGLMYGLIYDGVYHYNDFDRTTTGGYILKNGISGNGNTRANIQPGDIKYRGINGDGSIDANDYTVIGHSLPVHIGGFTNNFTYKNFDLNIFFQWSYGNDIQNANNLAFNGNVFAKTNLNQYASYDNRWSASNPNSNLVRTGGYTGAYSGYSSLTVEDGSYLRLKTLSLGYSLPNSVIKRLKIKKIRAYAAAQNVFTWTKYSGQDPEVNAYNSVLTGGFDWSTYPKARTITFGVNVTF